MHISTNPTIPAVVPVQRLGSSGAAGNSTSGHGRNRWGHTPKTVRPAGDADERAGATFDLYA